MRAKMHKFLSATLILILFASSALAQSGPIQSKPVTTTIANGASLSGAVDLGIYRGFAIQMPAAWTAANLTFQGSSDCSTYANLYDDTGTEVLVTAAASTYIVFSSPAKFQGLRCLKIRSGTSGAAVNQGADRILTVIPNPL
jgi:hypothetical protein